MFGTSPEWIVPGVKNLDLGPELNCSEAIAINSSKSTWIISIIIQQAVAIASAQRNNRAAFGLMINMVRAASTKILLLLVSFYKLRFLELV
nr:hypothetical protein [Tanacetum cinerariifolium]